MSPAHAVLQSPTPLVITDAYGVPEQQRAGIGRGLFEALLERGLLVPVHAPTL